MEILEGTLVLIRPLPETVIFSKNAWCCGFFDLMKHTQQGENLLSLMQGRWYFEILTFTKMYTCTVLYTTLKNLNMSENWLGMQISNFRYANMDFFKTPHIQIRFLWKDPVFKYEFLWLFIYPWCIFLSFNCVPTCPCASGSSMFHLPSQSATWCCPQYICTGKSFMF